MQFLYVKAFSSSAVDKFFGSSDGAEMMVLNIMFNQTFRCEVTQPLWKTPTNIILVVLPQA